MGRVFEVFLDSPKIFSCAKCRAHLSCAEEIISKVRLRVFPGPGRPVFARKLTIPSRLITPCIIRKQNFQGTSGKAYLFDSAYVARHVKSRASVLMNRV